MKSLAGSVPDFNGVTPLVISPRIHAAHSSACGPFSTPSAVLKPSRLIRSPPKLCRNGE